MRALAFGVLLGVLGLAVCATFQALATPTGEELEQYTFEKYITDFGKQYGTHEERNGRKKIFKKNLAEVIAFNKVPGRSYRLGVNHLSDLKKEEFEALYTGIVDAPAPPESPRVSFYSLNKPLYPEAFSWQDAKTPVLTPVKSQGSCGACWAFAAVECLESMHAIRTGELLKLSTQQITSCSDAQRVFSYPGGCKGGMAPWAWDYVKRAGGITLEKDYPYTNEFKKITEKCVLNDSMPRVIKVAGHTILPRNDEDAVIQALVTKCPLAVVVASAGWWFYSGGIFDASDAGGTQMLLNHVVQLVGYGADNKTKKDYWIVRNSWTAAWGENGYIRVLRNKTREPCVCNSNKFDKNGVCVNKSHLQGLVCGTCGILHNAAYPEVANAVE